MSFKIFRTEGAVYILGNVFRTLWSLPADRWINFRCRFCSLSSVYQMGTVWALLPVGNMHAYSFT